MGTVLNILVSVPWRLIFLLSQTGQHNEKGAGFRAKHFPRSIDDPNLLIALNTESMLQQTGGHMLTPFCEV